MKPMNTFETILLAAALLGSGAVQAATVTTNFEVTLDSGPLVGQTHSGWFSYDDSAFALGDEFASLIDFNFDFAGNTYTLSDADITPVYWQGSLTGLDFLSTSNLTSLFAFIPDLPGYFAYDLVNGNDIESGYGDVAYRTDVSAVPLPGAFALMLGGLPMLYAFARRRS